MVKAYESKYEKRYWDLYVSIYPNMTTDTFIAFEEFYKPSRQVEVENKNIEDILVDVKGILDTFNGGENYRDI